MNCDSCNATIEKPVYCCDNCRLKAYRSKHNGNASVTNDSGNETEAFRDNEDETPALQNVIEDNSDEYIIPTAPCWQCSRPAQWDDEVEGYKCMKCKQVTRLKAE